MFSSTAEKFPNEVSYREMCSSLSGVALLETHILQNWLSKMITSPRGAPVVGTEIKPATTPTASDTTGVSEETVKIQENRLLLQSITSYIVKDGSHVGEEVAKAILTALLPMGSSILSATTDGMVFSELMVVMATLAGAGSGNGHVTLVNASFGWLEQWYVGVILVEHQFIPQYKRHSSQFIF